MGFQVFSKRGEGKGLTVEVECNGGPPYSDRQRHNNLISVPNCNASDTNEHLVPKNHSFVVDEDVRAENYQQRSGGRRHAKKNLAQVDKKVISVLFSGERIGKCAHSCGKGPVLKVVAGQSPSETKS
jgi:hypothetical protein